MNHLIGAALDRLDELRPTGGALTPDTRILLLDDAATSVLIREEPDPRLAWRLLGEVPEAIHGEVVLLGEGQGSRWGALAATAMGGDGGAGARLRLEGVRAAASALPTEEAGLVVYAAGLLGWHRRARFCGQCGSATTGAAAGHQRVCGGCGLTQFPRTDPAVITLVRRGERALLVSQPRWPRGRFAAVAGFVEPGETLEQAVAREVAEEVGLSIERAEYLGSQPWPFPHSLMIGFRSVAGAGELRLGPEIGEARWFTREELGAAVAEGEVTLPTTFSISRSLVDDWVAGPDGASGGGRPG